MKLEEIINGIEVIETKGDLTKEISTHVKWKQDICL